ncbi:MAG: hypothetical protein GXO87_04525 [Chlorobi bacterium]|nr:hypothetical protein [Chlorobiota bacterium]
MNNFFNSEGVILLWKKIKQNVKNPVRVKLFVAIIGKKCHPYGVFVAQIACPRFIGTGNLHG